MERSHVVKRFRELGWDPVLPDPQDDRNARALKIQNLRQALQVRQTLVNQALAGGDLATSSNPPPPLLPIKRPARMHKISTEKDPSYQTPPAQKMSAPGLALGSKPPLPQLNTNDSYASGSALATTTGPKAAALTAQGLLVSGDTKKQPNTDPLSRLLQGNNNKAQQQQQSGGGGGGGGGGEDGRNPVAAPAAGLPLLAAGSGWNQTVHHPEEHLQLKNPLPRPPQQQQTRLAAGPSLRRSQRPRGTSRLVNSSGATALLTTHHNTVNTTTGNISTAISSDDGLDPIIASPTQSPPIKLTMPRVIDNSPKKNNVKKGAVAARQGVGKKKRKLDVLKLGEIAGEKEEMETEEEEEKDKAAGEKEKILAVAEKTPFLNVPLTRPTPLYERTQAPHGPRSRRLAIPLPLPLPPLSESVPATPAGLFDVSETPEEVGGAPSFKKVKGTTKNISGTELAQDASNRLLPGVFSPLTDRGLQPIAEEGAVENKLKKKSASVDGGGGGSRGGESLSNKMPLRSEETEATPAAYTLHRHLSSPTAAPVLATGFPSGSGGCNNNNNSGRGRQQLQPTSKRLANLLAADMVPETAVDDIDVYALDTTAPEADAAAAAEAEAPPCGGAGAIPVTTTGKKVQSAAAAAVPPQTALPTLRPFSPYAHGYSLPRSTDRRLQFHQSIVRRGRLAGGGSGGGNITPLPLQPPQSLLLGSRATTGVGPSSTRSAVCPLPTAEEPRSLKLRLSQPALAVVTSEDGRFMAVLLGSHADWEPNEVLVFAICLERAPVVKRAAAAVEAAAAMDDDENAANLPRRVPASAAKVVASISVQRSHHATGLPITPSSLALASTPKGEPILILSGVFDLPDGPASLGRPTIHAVHCGSTNSTSTTTTLANPDPTTTTTTSVAGTALGVESDDPFFSIAMLGPHTLLAVGDGSSSSGASVIDFDANWKSYSWGRSLPPAIRSSSGTSKHSNLGRNGSGSAGGSAVGLDDVCSLLITPNGRSDKTSMANNNSNNININNKQKQQRGSSNFNYTITGMSATGMIGSWKMGSTVAKCIATGSHAGYAVRAAIPIPHISMHSSDGDTSPKAQCFVALLQSRESPIGETAVAVATLSPSGGLALGKPVPIPVPVTAIGCLAPLDFSPSAPPAQETTTTPGNTTNKKYHHNQDKILLGCGNGSLRVWNIRTGVCSPPLDVCCGAAITSFATTTSMAEEGARNEKAAAAAVTEAVICTSIAGDCVLIETAALIQSCTECSS